MIMYQLQLIISALIITHSEDEHQMIITPKSLHF